jgi:hypothetical protein
VWLDPDGDSEDLADNRVPTLIRVKDKCISTFIERKRLHSLPRFFYRLDK